MKTKISSKCHCVIVFLFMLTTSMSAQVATITGPVDQNKMPATLGNGLTSGQEYTTDPGMTNYTWSVSTAGTIESPQPWGEVISVTWTNPTGQQSVSVSYQDPAPNTLSAVLIINYYPYAPPIDPTLIPQFVDPLPHFAAGLRVKPPTGGNLVIQTFLKQQIALSKGTPVTGGIIGDNPDAGKGNYAVYGISTDDGANFGPAMWPAQTIEVQQDNPITVKYENGLTGVTYDDFNILADQTLMMNGYNLAGSDPLVDPYRGDIPMVVHLHGGEIPSGSDGGPNAWFTPGFKQTGPAFEFNQSSSSDYPNKQEAATLWYHPHDDGLTRINVYTGLAGFYFLRGADEEAAMLPGWKGDGMVRESTPAGDKYSPTFNGTNAYLPEIEIAIQDRMFNVDGGLYWPVAPPNPDIHPYWTPEFVGDIMTVNGKSWPYLSVAPRKYRFRMLDGCNARFLDMWLCDAADNTIMGPPINVIGGEGGLLETPVVLDMASGKTLLMAPGQRYDVVIDFTGYTGRTFMLMNKAGSPYPGGDPVIKGLTDRIMQFIVNGENVGTDNSALPANLRPVNSLVKLTDFAGKINVPRDVHRQIILNEVSTAVGGPAAVLVNNSYFDAALSINPSDPYRAGGPSEFQTEGTTEMFEVINVSADAHPIHIHLLQWQLVSRTPIDDVAYLNDYAAAWKTQQPGIAEYPAGLGYPGGAGTPYPYNTINAAGAIGGNPAPTLLGAPQYPKPEEMGWKDNVIVMPGEVTTFMVRIAPTDRPLNAQPKDLLFPFDPSEGPGYVWHCHIIDHEDMSMMRPLPILPSPLRYPQITAQPLPKTACLGDVVTFSVTATSLTTIAYQWKVSTDAGGTWLPLKNDAVYTGTDSYILGIKTGLAPAPLSGNLYQCDLSNPHTTISAAALLTVNNCSVTGTLKYKNLALDPMAGATVSIGGFTAVTDALGAFTITGITSGALPVIVTHGIAAGGINATDAGSITAWSGNAIPEVTYLAGDVDNAGLGVHDATWILNNFVSGTPPFIQAPWVYSNEISTTSVKPPAFTVTVNGTSVTGFNILAKSTGDYNGSFSPVTPGVSTVTLASTGLAIKVPAATPFDLPVNSVSSMQTGAISLILNVPSALVTVNSVKVPGSTTAASWNHAGNVLKIGWYSATPVNIAAGGALVVLNMTPTSGFTLTESLKPTLVASYLNELSDGLFIPIANPALTVDNVQVTAKVTTSAAIVLTIQPNPVPRNSTAIISYTLPSPGSVTLGIYDAKGVLIKSLLNNQNITQLTGTENANLAGMIKGSYYLNLTLVSAGVPPQTSSLKFMIK